MNNLPNDQLNNYEDEIDLSELFHVLWDKIFYIGAITSIFSLISIIYALMLPNIYQSKATMMAVEQSSGLSGMVGKYSGMASLANKDLDKPDRVKTLYNKVIDKKPFILVGGKSACKYIPPAEVNLILSLAVPSETISKSPSAFEFM